MTESKGGSSKFKMVLIAIGAVIIGLILWKIYLWVMKFIVLAICILVAGLFLWWKFGRNKKKSK
jgi:predicted MFS family arabinose efflux permease